MFLYLHALSLPELGAVFTFGTCSHAFSCRLAFKAPRPTAVQSRYDEYRGAFRFAVYGTLPFGFKYI